MQTTESIQFFVFQVKSRPTKAESKKRGPVQSSLKLFIKQPSKETSSIIIKPSTESDLVKQESASNSMGLHSHGRSRLAANTDCVRESSANGATPSDPDAGDRNLKMSDVNRIPNFSQLEGDSEDKDQSFSKQSDRNGSINENLSKSQSEGAPNLVLV